MPREAEQDLRENLRVQVFCQALAVCADDPDLLLEFLRDILGDRELRDAANRWAAAEQLLSGLSVAQVVADTGISSRAVRRIHQWACGHFTTGSAQKVHDRLQQANASPH